MNKIIAQRLFWTGQVFLNVIQPQPRQGLLLAYLGVHVTLCACSNYLTDSND